MTLQYFDTVGWVQKVHRVCNKLCWYSAGDDLTAALHVLAFTLYHQPVHHLLL